VRAPERSQIVHRFAHAFSAIYKPLIRKVLR
jgi:hypothetical protein